MEITIELDNGGEFELIDLPSKLALDLSEFITEYGPREVLGLVTAQLKAQTAYENLSKTAKSVDEMQYAKECAELAEKLEAILGL